MLFTYKVINEKGQEAKGDIDAPSQEAAVESLQRRGMIVISVAQKDVSGKTGISFSFGSGVALKDIVIMSRQLSTLFEAQVSAIKAFNLLAQTSSSKKLSAVLVAVSTDVQGGLTIAGAMQKHPEVFSDFYVNMVRAGEESGKLMETFLFLADYLERQYELTTKTRNALIYPAFVIATFIVVMILMLTMVIPRLSSILIESGQQLPIYTRVVMWISDFFVNYGIFIFIAAAIAGFVLWSSSKTESGKARIDDAKISIPYIGDLFQKIYLARISDNINTMLSAGIPVVRTLEITASVVGNVIYRDIILDAVEGVKSGSSISQSFARHPEIPPIMVSMIQVGEETGSLGKILKTVSRFYKREVDSAVDTLIGLIEPAMIIMLGVGVGFLLTSVLVPIYNIAGSIQ